MASTPLPSPPPPANETRGGLLTKLAQKIAGMKWFVNGISVGQNATAGIDLNPGGMLNGNPHTRKLYYSTGTGYTHLEGYLYTDITGVTIRLAMMATRTMEIAGNMQEGNTDANAFDIYNGFVFSRDGSRLLRLSNGQPSNAANIKVTFDRYGGMRIAGTGTDANPVFRVTKDGKLHMQAGDSSGVPGDATLNTPMGKSVIPAGASVIRITNNLINTTTTAVEAWIQQSAADATLHYFKNRKVSAGYFELEGNAPATANVTVWWRLIN